MQGAFEYGKEYELWQKICNGRRLKSKHKDADLHQVGVLCKFLVCKPGKIMYRIFADVEGRNGEAQTLQ